METFSGTMQILGIQVKYSLGPPNVNEHSKLKKRWERNGKGNLPSVLKSYFCYEID